MNETFRQELDRQLSGVTWTKANAEAVFTGIRPRRRPVRMAIVLAAVLAALLALAGIGYAEYHSGILSSLFGEREVRREAEELLVSESVSMTCNGITVTITEYLYDGQSMHIAGEMRNDTEHALLCGMKDMFGGSGSGVFSLSSHLNMLQPGETMTGQTRISDLTLFQKMACLWNVEIRAVALKPVEEVRPDVNDTEYYSLHTHYGTDLTETVFEEAMRFPMRMSRQASRTIPDRKEIRMEKYGYTVEVSTANFAAASSEVRFEVIPDDAKDILAYGDEGQDGHERLYRRYEVLNEQGERLFKGLTGSAGFGWKKNQTRLEYSFFFGPLERVPERIVLVPVDDEGTYVMQEAAVVPILTQ